MMLVNLTAFFLRRIFNKDNIGVGWLLCGDENTASSRIQGINIYRFLSSNKKIDSIILTKPKRYSTDIYIGRLAQWFLLHAGFDIIVFQKVYSGNAQELARKCGKRGIRTLLLLADMPDFREIHSLEIYDHIVVVSKFFKEALVLKRLAQSKITAIEDAIETPRSLCKDYNTIRDNSDIKVVWVGYQTQSSNPEIVRKALRDNSLSNYRLVTISRGEADIKWDSKTVWREILKCDIAVIPLETASIEHLIKSNNRLTMFKALGLPVICSPIPAYRDIVVDGENGFLAEDLDDWVRCLNILKDADIRRQVGLADREKIFSAYNINVIGEKYLDLFCALKNRGKALPISTRGEEKRAAADRRIYILCPDSNIPAGGIKQLYRHVDVLNKNGFSAYILHAKEGFRCSWFENNTKIAYQPDISRADYLCVPEGRGPDIANIKKGVKKVILNQNPFYTFRHYSFDKHELKTPYLDKDIIATVVFSAYNFDYLKYAFPALNVIRVHYGFDESLFYYNAKKKRQIAFMPRKCPNDALQLINILKFRKVLGDFELVKIDNMREKEVANILRESLIFLSFSHREGFPMPPAEAMACGCIVIGYDGVGGREFFKNEFCYPIEDGDLISFANTVEAIIKQYETDKDCLLKKRRTASEFILKNYSLEAEEKDIVSVWSKILNEQKRCQALSCI